MLLKSIDGNTLFELKVLDYEFREITHDTYDSNWLMVQIHVKAGEIEWSSSDPCMLTWESHWLLNWLSDAAIGDEAQPSMSFLESNLEFRLASIANGTIKLAIRFRERLRPPNARRTTYQIVIETTQASIGKAAGMLCEELRSFPSRAGVSWRCRPGGDNRTDCILCDTA